MATKGGSSTGVQPELDRVSKESENCKTLLSTSQEIESQLENNLSLERDSHRACQVNVESLEGRLKVIEDAQIEDKIRSLGESLNSTREEAATCQEFNKKLEEKIYQFEGSTKEYKRHIAETTEQLQEKQTILNAKIEEIESCHKKAASVKRQTVQELEQFTTTMGIIRMENGMLDTRVRELTEETESLKSTLAGIEPPQASYLPVEVIQRVLFAFENYIPKEEMHDLINEYNPGVQEHVSAAQGQIEETYKLTKQYLKKSSLQLNEARHRALERGLAVASISSDKLQETARDWNEQYLVPGLMNAQIRMEPYSNVLTEHLTPYLEMSKQVSSKLPVETVVDTVSELSGTTRAKVAEYYDTISTTLKNVPYHEYQVLAYDKFAEIKTDSEASLLSLSEPIMHHPVARRLIPTSLWEFGTESVPTNNKGCGSTSGNDSKSTTAPNSTSNSPVAKKTTKKKNKK